MGKMKLTTTTSSFTGYSHSLSEPHMEADFSSIHHKICRSASFTTCSSFKGEKLVTGLLSASFRRALSESNLIPTLIKNEETKQRIYNLHWCRVMCSRKNGLLVAADSRVEFNRMLILDEDNVNSLNLQTHDENSMSSRQFQMERDSILRPAGFLGETHMNLDFVDNVEDDIPAVCERISENVVVEENSFGLQIGKNRLALVCTERGCRPAHLSESEYLTEGSFIEEVGGGTAHIGGNEGSSGVDFNSIDVYYQKMLEANPGNTLLLTNYAKFLHEVQYDVDRVEKYYGRAILASPRDGDLLSLYAKFIWETYNDAARAQVYFDRAVEAAPEESYVLASYANFLWNSEEDEEENGLPVRPTSVL